MRHVAVLVVVGLVVAACSGTRSKGVPPGQEGNGGSGTAGGSGGGQSGTGAGGDGAGCVPGGTALTVTPSNGSATVTAGETFAFEATVDTSGGSVDATRRVSWSVSRQDDSPPGTIDAAGTFTPSPGTGGLFQIEATDGCLVGKTTFTVKLQAAFGADPSATAGFDGATIDTTTAARLPSIVYPQDQTRFPRNIYKVLFQWKKAGSTRFRLTFLGPYSTTTIFTNGVHPDCAGDLEAACWQADATTWAAIAGSNAGAVTHLTVDAIGDGETTIHRAPGIDIGFSRRDVKGAIFYWSTTAAGIRRASVSDSDPQGYLVGKPVPTVLPSGDKVQCVACHAVSRSGKKIVGFTQAGSTGEYVYDVTADPPPTPVITTQISTQKGFGTFSPDDSRLVATVGKLLAEFDAASGSKLADLPVPAGTNPDWSPTGTELAYSDVGGDSPGSANLKIIERQNGSWGSIRTLAAAAGKTNLFPSYSPDGAYVSYARGKGGHGDKTLQLILTKSDGSQEPVELLRANRAVNNCLGVVCDASGLTSGQYENNMPTWAPAGDLLWVAFNSRRPYGEVLPAGGTQQIWVAAIDPAKLGQKDARGALVDPSYPAFRFAFQDLAENNHRAFWALDVRDPDTGQCVAEGQRCNAGSTCCQGLTCQPATEFDYTCQSGSTGGGSCIDPGNACDQTSGDPCCAGSLCDVGPDGGTICQTIPIN